MKTIWEDMGSNVNEVDRGWLRIPAVVIGGFILIPLCIVVYAFRAIYDTFVQFLIPAWTKKPFKGFWK